ncbi:aspartate carbamoyltransferase [Candidatus Daviesbacteria bacterium]|nr:aspartate carbamoyltransferase [Candidatus Daviesbacteria bacterium]
MKNQKVLTTNYTKINGDFKGKDILSSEQFDLLSIKKLFSVTGQMAAIAKNARPSDLLKGKISTLLFFEPSSRTFGSFSASMKQLGGQTIEMTISSSSMAKGESFEDTIRTYEAYCDLIVIRHPEVGSVQKAAEIAKYVPIINAGDGIGEHPTQALYDLYTIKEKFPNVNKLHVVFFGELAHYRPVNSLAMLLSLYPGIKISFVSPPQVKLNQEVYSYLKERNIQFQELVNIDDVIGEADVLYVTRVKKEFLPAKLYKQIQGKYSVDKKLVNKMKKESIIMHALPRVGEISTEIDNDPRAVYLKAQVRNGMYVRMALLKLVLKG